MKLSLMRLSKYLIAFLLFTSFTNSSDFGLIGPTQVILVEGGTIAPDREIAIIGGLLLCVI